MVTQQDPDNVHNTQVATGTSPLYICGQCRYTPVSYPNGQCTNCRDGLPRPDLSFIKQLSDQGVSLDQFVSDR